MRPPGKPPQQVDERLSNTGDKSRRIPSVAPFKCQEVATRGCGLIQKGSDSHPSQPPHWHGGVCVQKRGRPYLLAAKTGGAVALPGRAGADRKRGVNIEIKPRRGQIPTP